MQQSHSIPFPLQWGRKSSSIWSLVPTGHAIVFVHGFGGKAITTWNDFPRILRTEARFAGSDLFFFGYRSKRQRAQISAIELREFLKTLLSNPAGLANQFLSPAHPRPPTFHYDRVFIVAHSLGAVVTRRALLDSLGIAQNGNRAYSWTGSVRIVLFAPAHMGANALALASEALVGSGIPGLGMLMPIAKLIWPVLTDLDEGSPVIKKLQEETTTALRRGGADCLRAIRVVFAANDNVVNPYRFGEDTYDSHAIPGSHTRVCKPSEEFMAPYHSIADVLP